MTIARDRHFRQNNDRVRHIISHLGRAQRPEGRQGGGPRISHLEKIKIPAFSGKSKDWGEFVRIFKELTKYEDLANPILLSILHQSLPPAAKVSVAGLTDPEEAWKRLGRRFGDKNLIILNVRQRLLCANISKGSHYDQLEALCQEVE